MVFDDYHPVRFFLFEFAFLIADNKNSILRGIIRNHLNVSANEPLQGMQIVFHVENLMWFPNLYQYGFHTLTSALLDNQSLVTVLLQISV